MKHIRRCTDLLLIFRMFIHKRGLEILKNIKSITCNIKRYLSHDYIHMLNINMLNIHTTDLFTTCMPANATHHKTGSGKYLAKRSNSCLI